MFGELDTEEVEVLLHSQVIARLGITDRIKPYVVPISYAYDGDYIYGFSQEGLKIDLMRRNPLVCIEVEDTSNISNWQSVIAWGKFEELKHGPKKDHALKLLNNRILPILNSETMRLSPLWPFVDIEESRDLEGVVYRIKLKEKSGRFEKNSEIFYAYPVI